MNTIGSNGVLGARTPFFFSENVVNSFHSRCTHERLQIIAEGACIQSNQLKLNIAKKCKQLDTQACMHMQFII